MFACEGWWISQNRKLTVSIKTSAEHTAVMQGTTVMKITIFITSPNWYMQLRINEPKW